MGVAVIGGGIRGLVSAYVLAEAGINVVVYEKEEQLGGHAKTVTYDAIDLDLGLFFLDPAKYATMLELFDSLGVDVETSDVSFSVSHDKGNGYEWCSQYGLSNQFAHKKKILNPYNWQDLREIIKFGNDANSYLESLENNPDIERNETLGQFVKSKGYSENFQNTYLATICGSIWSCSGDKVMSLSAFSVLSYCRTHHLYQLFGQPQWLTIKGHSYFVKKVRDILESKGCQFKLGCQVRSVLPADNGSTMVCGDGFQETYNGCIMAVDAPSALGLLGNQATFEEMRVLGAFQYAYSDIFLHRDSNLMPKDNSAWSALNFLGSRENKACLTYWLNVLQNVGKTSRPFFVTLNPDRAPNSILLKWSTGHPIPSVAASKASLELDQIQGKRGIWFCGYDFHEDELQAGMNAAHGILGKQFCVLRSPRHMSLSYLETMARLFVTKFFRQFISAGCVVLLEEGGRIFTFKGDVEKCSLKTVLKVHNPQFYWRIMTEADLGLADAYIQGDFSFVDKDKGLLNLLRILIANKELSAASGKDKRRSWRSPALFTAGLSSAKQFLKHYLRQNTVTQARRNIARHYDLSNELFGLYLGKTMQYSSGVFKTGEEHLDVAQRRKISSLIEKTRIENWHEVLDIGCGWGSLAIEVVKRTGCNYTGITLSEQQLKYAEEKVKEAGLQGKIKILLCDYRQLPKSSKFDRIISVEMVEHVGEEYIEEFFRCCDTLLAENGLFTLQFISIPEELHNEIQQTAGFLKEYIFPGGTLLSLDRTLSAMAAASRFSCSSERCWCSVIVEEMGVAVIGGGIRGLVSAYVLAKAGINVVVYEKEEQLGGHSKTVTYDAIDLDLGLFFLDPAKYATMLELFDSLGVDVEASDVSFSVSHDKGNGYEWCSQYGLSNQFAHKKKILNPYNWQDLREIIKFGNDANSYLESLENNPDIERNETLGQFVKSKGYSENFQNTYLATICGSIWSCSGDKVMSLSAFSVLSYCRTHHLYQLFGQPQWLTIKGHSYFVKKFREILESKGCQFKLGRQVRSVLPADNGSTMVCGDGFQETYNGCIMAVDAPTALGLLGNQATFQEMRVLGAFQYASSDIFLHRDSNLMPKDNSAWSALNFLGSRENKACLTYWLNVLQNVGKTSRPFFVTLNPDRAPNSILLKWSTGHPIPSVAASKASLELDQIQGKRGIWFCGYDFHEDELQAGMNAAHGILGKQFCVLRSPRHMSLSYLETMARLFVTKFFRQFISAGCVVLLEEGGRIFTFKGDVEKCSLKTVLKVHNPQFYWRIMTEADLGLADAYIQGDFSFVDKDKGLLNLLRILIANKELSAASGKDKRRSWRSPALFTAGLSSAKQFLKHYLRQNTVTQARRNIARHYDLSNELFGLYLGKTMQYSSGVFKTGEEHLDVAQRRKISSLIEKTRIENWHEVLDIGCGWGSLAIEVVKRTGCNYTGITLSEQQLKYAEEKVKEAGLQGKIKILLCDYRQLPKSSKFDRIISVEMVEHVGEEYIEEFFRCCDTLLAENGLFTLQFISIPEELHNEIQQTAGFLKEYIFPGGTLLSLDRTLSAMAAASRFSVEHVENIGISYFHTLRWWRKNFLSNKSKVLALGFDEKFIRTWEYYFDYCASGFKTGTLIDYQVVFSRAGNFTALGDPYTGFPSAYSFMDN
ncbi:hypothetical protein PTKIN_Ptkin10aG0034700 [Pterospermum kingtungense]